MKITQFNINIFKSEIESLERHDPEVWSVVDNFMKEIMDLHDTLAIFKIDSMLLSGQHPDLMTAIDTWIEKQAEREKQGAVNISGHRQHLETLLTEYRHKLAQVYDFMGDRGLVNFEPTGFADELGVEDLSAQF